MGDDDVPDSERALSLAAFGMVFEQQTAEDGAVVVAGVVLYGSVDVTAVASDTTCSALRNSRRFCSASLRTAVSTGS